MLFLQFENTFRRIVTVVLLAMISPLYANDIASTSTDSEKHIFHYKFREGDILKWEVGSYIEQMTAKANQKDTTDTRSVSTKIWKVLSVDENGQAVLEYSIADVEMRCYSSYEKAERRYDSKTDEKPPVEYMHIAELIGKPIAHFTINSQGEIVNRVQKANVAVTMQFAETAEENRITIPMPEYAIGVGDSWDYPREIMLPKPNGTVKKVTVHERYTLEKMQDGTATFSFKTFVITPLYDDKESE